MASDGTQTNGNSSTATAISADGRYVSFSSLASNLVPGNTNFREDVFVHDRGPAIGIGGLAVQTAPGQVAVSGWATFSGVSISSAEDLADDGVDALGAEITGASVTYRPEQEDFLVRTDLASLPGPVGSCLAGPCVGAPSTGAGAPGVVYRWGFTVEETAYEIRALRAAGTATPPTTEPYFGLYDCASSCTEITQLSGGIGAAGADVRVSVPLAALAAEEGATLVGITASAALGEAAPGALVILDDVALPDASIPVTRVELAIAPPSASQADVSFSAPVELVEGRFSATLDVSTLPPGAHRVWARACLGETCGAAWVEVAL